MGELGECTACYYFWSPLRKGWIVYDRGALFPGSYASLSLLQSDWPEAIEA